MLTDEKQDKDLVGENLFSDQFRSLSINNGTDPLNQPTSNSGFDNIVVSNKGTNGHTSDMVRFFCAF